MKTLWLILLSDVFYIAKSYGKLNTIYLLTALGAGPFKNFVI